MKLIPRLGAVDESQERKDSHEITDEKSEEIHELPKDDDQGNLSEEEAPRPDPTSGQEPQQMEETENLELPDELNMDKEEGEDTEQSEGMDLSCLTYVRGSS